MRVLVQELEALLDGHISGLEFFGTHVRVHGILCLLVAALVERAQVEPNLGDVWVQPDRTRVGVEGVLELVDLEVEDTDGDPKCRIATVAVDGLLVRFVGLVVLLRGHVGTSKEIPALSVGWICKDIVSKAVSTQSIPPPVAMPIDR